jgi:hypothetical protein
VPLCTPWCIVKGLGAGHGMPCLPPILAPNVPQCQPMCPSCRHVTVVALRWRTWGAPQAEPGASNSHYSQRLLWQMPGFVYWACVHCVLSDLLRHMPRSHLGSQLDAGHAIAATSCKRQAHIASSRPRKALKSPCLTPTASSCAVKLPACAPTMGLVIH